jgi:hypothetical protein
MTNAIKVLLQRQSGFLQLESTLDDIFFRHENKLIKIPNLAETRNKMC